jgi:hypothetical protein
VLIKNFKEQKTQQFLTAALPDLTPGIGADGRIRTADQLITNQLLYQLSYIGSRFFIFI